VFKRIAVTGTLAGLNMGFWLFLIGALAARIIYGPQFAPEDKFEPDQISAWYFFWTKLVIGVFFGLLFTGLYEAVPLSRRVAGISGGLKYALLLWLIVSLWGLSHKVMYETLQAQKQVFWLVYSLGGYIGYGLAFGYLCRRWGNGARAKDTGSPLSRG